MLQSRNLASKLLAQRVCTRVCSIPGRMTCRNQSSGPNKSSGVRSAVLIGTGTAVGSVVGALGYAWYDPAFRTAVESTVPYSDVLFSSVIGQHPSVASSITAPLKPIYPPKTSTQSDGLATGKLEASQSQSKKDRAVLTSESVDAVQVSPPLLVESSPAAPVASSASSSASVEPSLSSSAPVAPTASSDTPTSLASSAEAVSPVAETPSTSKTAVQSTAAVQLPEDTGDSLQQLLDSLSEATMQVLHEAIAAQERAAAAVSDHVDVVFRNISDSAATTWDDVTRSAFLKKQLCDAADQLAATAKDSIGQLKDAVRQAEKSTSVHTNERLISAQQTLAMAYRTLEMAKLKHKRMESAGLTGDQLRSELSRHQHKLEMDYRRQMVVFQEELEAQLRQQLRRQAAAHSDHIQDVLAAQEEELARRHEAAHEHQLRMERLKQEATSSAMMGQLAGLQEALKNRADVDAVALASHRMWTACLALYQAVATPSTDATHQRTCIQQQTDIIRRLSADGDVLVQLVLSSLPAAALRDGVASEHQLKQRFVRLERVCRRVGMIDDRGGSLFKYALSYLQALMVVDAYDPAPGAAHSEPISADMDTFGLVARARYAMDVGDLTQAVRYMSMLRGESGRAAADWLRESRQLLEVRQAAEALMAHAASCGLQATHTD